MPTRSRASKGGVVAVRVLNAKGTYNQLELPSGRMSQVKPGDVVAGALGHRKALFGYSGHLPERRAPATVNLLNLGGVLGVCDSVNPDLGRAVRRRGARPGAALSRTSANASACRRTSAKGALPLGGRLDAARRAGRGARRLVHERRQDRRRLRAGPGVRPHRADAWPRARPPASRCAATCSRWRTPARVGRSSSPTSAWSPPRRRTRPRSRARFSRRPGATTART